MVHSLDPINQPYPLSIFIVSSYKLQLIYVVHRMKMRKGQDEWQHFYFLSSKENKKILRIKMHKWH